MDALNAEAEQVRLMSEDHNSLELPLRSRSDSRSSERTLLNMSDTELDEKRRSGDLEKEAATDGLLPKVEIKDHVTEDPLKRAKLTFWMAVNTVATVLIVSWTPSIDILQTKSAILAQRKAGLRVTPRKSILIIHSSAGLLQQSHLQRQILWTMSSRLRSLPLLRHSRYPLHPLTAHVLHVRP